MKSFLIRCICIAPFLIGLAFRFRILSQGLYANVLAVLSAELGEDAETVQRIFERMAQEDKANG